MQIETIITLGCQKESLDYLKLSTITDDEDCIHLQIHEDDEMTSAFISIGDLQQALSYFKLQKKAEIFLDDCQEALANG